MKNLSKAAQRRIDAACQRFQKQTQDTMKKDTNIERITIQVGNGPEITITEKEERK